MSFEDGMENLGPDSKEAKFDGTPRQLFFGFSNLINIPEANDFKSKNNEIPGPRLQIRIQQKMNKLCLSQQSIKSEKDQTPDAVNQDFFLYEPEPESKPATIIINRPRKTIYQPKQKSKFELMREKYEKYFSSSYFEIMMTMITIFILYGDDIRILIGNRDADRGFYIAFQLCILVFLLEIILLSIFRKGYICSFFFWMDLVSTLSTLLDIPWVMKLLGLEMLTNQTNIIKAGRASRVSTRATKMIRIIRLVRIIRISKLYKYAQQTIREKFQNLIIDNNIDNEIEVDDSNLLPSPDKKNKSFLFDSPGIINIKRESELKQKNEDITIDKQLLTVNYDQSFPFQNHMSNVKADQIQEFEEQQVRSNYQDILNNTIVQQNFPNNQQKGRQSPSRMSYQKRSIIIAKTNSIIIRDKRRRISLKPINDDKEIKVIESEVGKILSESTTKKVILLIFAVMVSIPFFDNATYWQTTVSFDSGLQILQKNQKEANFDFYLRTFLNFHDSDENRTPVSFLMINSIIYWDDKKYQNYNTEELKIYQLDSQNYVTTIDRQDVQLNAILGIIRTTFVIIIMVIAALYFSKDSTDLVVAPIENMLTKVKIIADNPLDAAKIEEDQEVLTEYFLQINQIGGQRKNQRAYRKKYIRNHDIGETDYKNCCITCNRIWRSRRKNNYRKYEKRSDGQSTDCR